MTELIASIKNLLGAFGFEGFSFEIPTAEILDVVAAIKNVLAGLED